MTLSELTMMFPCHAITCAAPKPKSSRYFVNQPPFFVKTNRASFSDHRSTLASIIGAIIAIALVAFLAHRCWRPAESRIPSTLGLSSSPISDSPIYPTSLKNRIIAFAKPSGLDDHISNLGIPAFDDSNARNSIVNSACSLDAQRILKSDYYEDRDPALIEAINSNRLACFQAVLSKPSDYLINVKKAFTLAVTTAKTEYVKAFVDSRNHLSLWSEDIAPALENAFQNNHLDCFHALLSLPYLDETALGNILIQAVKDGRIEYVKAIVLSQHSLFFGDIFLALIESIKNNHLDYLSTISKSIAEKTIRTIPKDAEKFLLENWAPISFFVGCLPYLPETIRFWRIHGFNPLTTPAFMHFPLPPLPDFNPFNPFPIEQRRFLNHRADGA